MVTLSNQVRDGIAAYWGSLQTYPITTNRAYKKYIEMENALNSLVSAICDRRCGYRDMGQKYLKDNTCVFPFLCLYVYCDKQSKSKWYFSYVRDGQDNVFVLQMKYSGLVKDDICINKKKIITESELKAIVQECVKRVISEATINGHTYPLEKQMGKWKCIDGIYWERNLPDCPEKGDVYDVRIYDNTEAPKGKYETYALWKRIDNGKYFYTTIVPNPEGNNQNRWKTVPLSTVPQEIRDDLRHLPLPPERVLKNPFWHRTGNHIPAE